MPAHALLRHRVGSGLWAPEPVCKVLGPPLYGEHQQKSFSSSNPSPGDSQRGELVASSNAACPQRGVTPGHRAGQECVHTRTQPMHPVAATLRLPPASVSTKCFQETSCERKQALIKNLSVKNVFLQSLEYFVLERQRRKIIKQPRYIPALALGMPMLCDPRAPSGDAPSPPCSCKAPLAPCCCGSKSTCCGVAPLQTPAAPAAALPAPGWGDRGSLLSPSRSIPSGTALFLAQFRGLERSLLSDQKGPLGFTRGLCVPCQGWQSPGVTWAGSVGARPGTGR